MTALITRRELRDVPLADIDLADENVRKSTSEEGIEELKASIESLGLIQPVVLLPKGNRFNLIVGQRRLRAFRALGKDRISAIIVNRVDPDQARLISFGENIHRRKLPYDDTIRVCDYLFTHHKGRSSQRIEDIALELNIHPNTVRKYLAYKLVPGPVQEMVTDGLLSPDIAYRITTAFWPNVPRIVEIATLSSELTSDEKRRLVEVGRRNPKASIDELLKKIRQPSGDVELVLHIDPDTLGSLSEAARSRKTDVDSLLKSVIEEWLKEEDLRR